MKTMWQWIHNGNSDSLRLCFSEMSPDEIQCLYCSQMSKNCIWCINIVSTVEQSLGATEWDANKASHCLSLWKSVALQALHNVPAWCNHRLPANVKKSYYNGAWWLRQASKSLQLWSEFHNRLFWFVGLKRKLDPDSLRLFALSRKDTRWWRGHQEVHFWRRRHSFGCLALNMSSWSVEMCDKNRVSMQTLSFQTTHLLCVSIILFLWYSPSFPLCLLFSLSLEFASMLSIEEFEHELIISNSCPSLSFLLHVCVFM